MTNNQLILMKVVVSAHENHRLKLMADDYENLVKGKKFESLKIELDDVAVIDFTKSILMYSQEGALAQKGRISKWITDNGFLNEADKTLLLFELTIDEKKKEHYYRFLGDANKLYDRISEVK